MEIGRARGRRCKNIYLPVRFFMILFCGNRRKNFQRDLAVRFKKKDKPNLRKDLKVLHHLQKSFPACSYQGLRRGAVSPAHAGQCVKERYGNGVFRKVKFPRTKAAKQTRCHLGQASGRVEVLCVSRTVNCLHRLLHGRPKLSEAIFRCEQRKNSTK